MGRWRAYSTPSHDYLLCDIDGPPGWSVRLCVETWQTDAEKWWAYADLVTGKRAPCRLWAAGASHQGLTRQGAMQAAEAWLTEWRAGWAAAGDAVLLAEIPDGGPLVVRGGE